MKNRFLSQEEKDKIIILYKQNLNTNQIAKILNRNQSTVERYLKKNGYKMNYGSRITKKDRNFIISQYINGLTCKDIWRQYYKDVYNSSAVIEKIIRNEGLSRGIYKKEVIVNHDYFENIDNEHKAYWLGILTADGCIRHKTENSWYTKLEIQYKDKYLLEIFKKDIETDAIIKDYKYGRKHNAMLIIYSKKWAEDLNKFDIVPNKTFKIHKLPNININLMKHFIRGYFDGDGCIMLYKPNDQILRRLKISICGTKGFLNNLNIFLNKQIGTTKNKLIDMNKYGSNVFNLRYTSNNDVIKFCEYIYSDYTICLERKKNKYIEFKNERSMM